jgi:catalase/putative intracellular protease/amidase
MTDSTPIGEQSKQSDLDSARQKAGEYLTTNQGVGVTNTNDSVHAGSRGPTLLEDFHMREKMAHFDRERIPERVVHARGSGAHGYFQPYESLAELTKAKFLRDPAVKTPVFARFSTVTGFRGSADTVRDVRGFSVKFYTEEGNYDFVGNNIPVFFIQDGIKFPDLVHAIKPEPHNEMPQAAAAHDNFWDFISLMPESMHMIMWVLSDRALPRSFRMMQGFGVHTFRFVNEAGKSRFVKFHWKPLLGVHSLVWDEAQKLAGKDPDFSRRDLWEAIEMGDFPEYELGVQIVEEEDEFKFDFDLLDPTNSKVNYSPNSLGGGCPMMSPETMGGFVHYAERVEGHKIRERSQSFQDHFSQATLFLNSMSEIEREHLVKAAHFELGKVQSKEVKERVLGLFAHIDLEFAKQVAAGLGLPEPSKEIIPNHGQSSPALSMEKMPKDSIKSRKVAILAADGFNSDELMAVKQALAASGAHAKIVSKHGGKIKSADGQEIDVEMTFLTAASVMFDAIYVPGGKQSINTLKQEGDAINFITEAFKHCKAIAASGEGINLFSGADLKGINISANGKVGADKGVVTCPSGGDLAQFSQAFVDAMMQHRHWMRTQKEMVPA